jgi:hypothetical protein
MSPLIRVALAIWLCAGFALAASAAQRAPTPPANDDCLACHADPTATRSNGTAVAVDPQVFGDSKHAAMACVDCHADLATLQEFPHPDRLAPVNCATCHDTAQEQYAQGVHGVARQNGRTLAATCVDCHSTHGIRGSDDPASPTSHLNLPAMCATCHGNPDIIKRGHIEIGDVATLYHDSIHGRALEKAGLLVAPSCIQCHGNHDIKRRTDASSLVHRRQVPATCGKCHAGILRQFEASIHGTALAGGDAQAPACNDCHTAHSIQRVETDAWQLAVTQECGTCHTGSMRTFRDTFHGQVSSLGFVRVAACADCHGSHDIQKKSDPRSTISEAKLVSTCQKCHQSANENFVRYDPHANRHDRARNPALYYTGKFMDILLMSVFIFFGIHTALWLPRAMKARREMARMRAAVGAEER